MDRTEFYANGKPYTFRDLSLAAETVGAGMLEDLPDILPAAQPSAAFEAGVESLHKRYRTGERFRRVGRSAASVAVALVLALSAFLTVNAGARGFLLNWWKERNDDNTQYWFDGEVKNTDVYGLSWVPEGLFLEESDIGDGDGGYIYTDGSQQIFIYDYMAMDGTGYVGIFAPGEDWENVRKETVTLSGKTIDFYENPNGPNDMVWIDEEHGVAHTLNGYLDRYTMLKIMENIVVLGD